MSEISEAQLAANRANATHSTGPRTEEGQKRSSLNAMKHGLTGRTVLLPREKSKTMMPFPGKSSTSSSQPIPWSGKRCN